MSGIDGARTMLESIVGYVEQPSGGVVPSQDRPVRLGVVDAGYSGAGNAAVRFDGETTTGLRTYVAIEQVAAGDRVVLLPVGNTYVILGSLGAAGSSGRAFREAAGTVTFGAVAAGASRTDVATFPVGRFTVPPLVFLTGNSARFNLAATPTTAAQTTINTSNWTGVATGAGAIINWHAVQMTPSSAAG